MNKVVEGFRHTINIKQYITEDISDKAVARRSGQIAKALKKIYDYEYKQLMMSFDELNMLQRIIDELEEIKICGCCEQRADSDRWNFPTWNDYFESLFDDIVNIANMEYFSKYEGDTPVYVRLINLD